MLPDLYAEDPDFYRNMRIQDRRYRNMRIQDLAQGIQGDP